MGLSNGALFGFVDNIISPSVVLSIFINALGGSNFLVGLAPAVYNGGWFLPQFLISHRLQRMPHKMGVYVAATWVRIVCWALIIAAIFGIGDTNHGLLLVVFFLLFTTYALAAGIGGAPFMDIVAKTIPVARRGTYFGRRDLSGAIMAILASYLITVLLNPDRGIPFPQQFGYLFVLAGVGVVFGLIAFCLVVEPVESTLVREVTFRDQLTAAGHILRENGVYRRFLLLRVAVAAADIATPFYAIYSVRVLGVPVDIVGLYIGFTTIAIVLANPMLSRVSDSRGHRIVLICAASGMLSMPLIALAFSFLPPGPALGLPFGLLFVIMGIARSAGNISLPSYLLEIAPAGERSLYIGFTNTILGVATFIPTIGGILVDLAGFQVIFVLTLLVGGFAWWLAKGLTEPRARALAPTET